MIDFMLSAIQLTLIVAQRALISSILQNASSEFERRTRATLERLTTANDAQVRRLVDELMEAGLDSPARGVFQEIGRQSRISWSQLKAIIDLRESIAQALGGDWQSYEQQLLDTLAQLVSGTETDIGMRINRLVTLGLESPAHEIFQRIGENDQTRSSSESTRSASSSGVSGEAYAKAVVTADQLNQISRRLLAQFEDAEEAAMPAPRYLNVGLVNPTTTEIHPHNQPLDTNTRYSLRIKVGRLETWDSDTNPKSFPEQHLPDSSRSDHGYWLDVIVSSADFAITPMDYALFLPEMGESWVCDCSRNDVHHCQPDERQEYLYIPVTSPASTGQGTLRVGIYYQNNLLQCRLLTAYVGELPGAANSYHSITDYTLSHSLTDLDQLQPRHLNIFTNENADRNHRVVMVSSKKTDGGNIVRHKILNTAEIANMISETRAVLLGTLLKIHEQTRVIVESDGRETVNEGDYEVLLRNLKTKGGATVNNAKNGQELIADLKRLAFWGYQLWVQLFEKGSWDDYDRLLREHSTIQVCRAEDSVSPLLLPWALIYDIPLDSSGRKSDSDQWDVCPSLTNLQWEPGKPIVDPTVSKCPHDDGQNHRLNMICPFGFWGFKHIIEQPPSLPEGRDLPTKIIVDGKYPQMLAGFSERLNNPRPRMTVLRDRFASALNMTAIGIESKDTNSVSGIMQALGSEEWELVYLYCHGLWRELFESIQPAQAAGGTAKLSFLEVGKEGERISPSDIVTYQRARWPKNHWQVSTPLVILNGCHTVELSPDALVSFVDAFVQAGAGGVIGTEVTITQDLADEVAELFFQNLLQPGMTVGKAIRQMRLDLLSKGNLMGLAYTPYCSADLQLTQG